MRASELRGRAVFAPRRGRAGAAGTYERLGRVRAVVFAPGGTRAVGVLVKRPDVAGMVRRADAFVALGGMAPCDGGLRATTADAVGDAGRVAAGVDGAAWDACVLWVGMDVATVAGHELGYVDDVAFDAATGAVSSFFVGDGGIARGLVGTVEVPARMLRGCTAGRMVVADDATTLAAGGGLAGRAGAAVGRAQVAGEQAAETAGEAVEAGSRALGRQLGKTRGMFGAFVSEYKKASR